MVTIAGIWVYSSMYSIIKTEPPSGQTIIIILSYPDPVLKSIFRSVDGIMVQNNQNIKHSTKTQLGDVLFLNHNVTVQHGEPMRARISCVLQSVLI